MPSAITLPTFGERELLLYQKLNAAMDAINAQFAAGVGSAEIAWPLTAGGNLDMSIYNIVNGRQIWGFVNAAEYDTFDDAVTAAGSGGVVLIPPETTVVTNGSSVTGTGTTVIGSGPSSVLQITADASSGYMLRFDSVTRGLLANLTLDGNSATGSGQEGMRISDCAGMVVHNVFFRNFSGALLRVQGDTSQVSIMGCHFNGGSEEQLYATQCDLMSVVGCTFETAGTLPIRLACASGSADLTVAIGDTVIDNAGDTGISFTGFNAAGSTSPGRLWMSNVGIKNTGGTTKDGLVAGTATAVLESCQISNCLVRSTTAGGMLINANYGTISGNTIEDPTTFGIDLDTSRYVTVQGNYINSATLGIDTSAGQNCMVTGNFLRDCTTGIAYGGTNHIINNNEGAFQSAESGSFDYVISPAGTYTGSVGDGAATLATLEIPAGVLRQGSVVEIWTQGRAGLVDPDGVTAIDLRVNGAVIAKADIGTAVASVNDNWSIHGQCVVVSCANNSGFGFGTGFGQTYGRVVITQDGTNVTMDCSTAINIDVYMTPATDLDNSTFIAKNIIVRYGHGQTRTFT